jgi:hypothetical protein
MLRKSFMSEKRGRTQALCRLRGASVVDRYNARHSCECGDAVYAQDLNAHRVYIKPRRRWTWKATRRISRAPRFFWP